MNNRTNLLKKRADTLAEYVIDRCDKMEKENSYMRQSAQYAQHELKRYDDAFFDALKKMEGIEKLDDGSIQIMFIDGYGAKMGQIIPVTGFLYPIAKMLLEKSERWRMKK